MLTLVLFVVSGMIWGRKVHGTWYYIVLGPMYGLEYVKRLIRMTADNDNDTCNENRKSGETPENSICSIAPAALYCMCMYVYGTGYGMYICMCTCTYMC
jgi:hypothetical protein